MADLYTRVSSNYKAQRDRLRLAEETRARLIQEISERQSRLAQIEAELPKFREWAKNAEARYKEIGDRDEREKARKTARIKLELLKLGDTSVVFSDVDKDLLGQEYTTVVAEIARKNKGGRPSRKW